jgi:SAM-dependent methyltransferase
MEPKWTRTDAAVVVDRGELLILIGRDDVARQFDTASAELIRLVLALLSSPLSQAQLAARLRESADVEDALLAETLAVLAAAGAIAAARAEAPAAAPARLGNVVLGISGAIAAVDAPALARMLLGAGFDVKVVMTPAAHKFVTPESLAAITHQPVYTSFWQAAAGEPAPHVQLATWADLVLVYPASAATLSRLVAGATDDLLAATVVASTCPVLVCPSMNAAMMGSPSVRRNLAQLRDDGHYLMEPRSGHEVAEAPHLRAMMFGVAHGPVEVLRAVRCIWQTAVQPRLVAKAESWEQQYSSRSPESLPWFTATLDEDLAQALGRVAASPPQRLLDLGTGVGTTAIFAAQAGFSVVATDISASALAIARQRAGSLPIAWLLDDITDSQLWGQFDVVVDRGCLHTLPRERWPGYAAEVGRRLVSGGELLLKQHAVDAGSRWLTHPLRDDDLETIFGALFDVAAIAPARFDGTFAPPPSAIFARLIRK